MQKEKIIQAFKEGRLGFRDIRIKYEKEYLAKNKRDPRPVYLVLHDTPITMRIKVNNRTIGIINPTTLACYKDSRSVTNYLSCHSRLHDLDGKLLADKNSLLTKMKEKADRNWEVYNIATSGHLEQDGTFSLPKIQQNNQGYTTIEEPEIVTTGYATEDIACYCIYKYDDRTISQILSEKHSLEETLAIKTPLPLVVYDENNGSIEICYEEEINNSLNTLTFNEMQLDKFSHSSHLIKELVNKLPFISKINILGTTKLDMSSGGCPPRSEIIDLVSSSKNYNVNKLKKLLRQGASVDIQLKNGNNSQSLIDQLLKTEINGCQQYKFFALFNELALQGCSMKADNLYCMRRINYFPKLFNNAIAFGLPISKIFLNDLLHKSIVGDHFATVALDQVLISMTNKELEDQLYKYCLDSSVNKDSSNEYQQIFMILFNYGADPTHDEGLMRNLYKETDMSEAVRNLMNMWETRESNPYYLAWPKKLTEANKTVDKLRQELGMFDKKPTTNTQMSDGEKTLINLLIEELNKPLVFNTIENNDATITIILQHYYRHLFDAQLLKISSTSSLSQIDNSVNLSSAVLRANNNVAWYVELLEKFNLATFSEEETTLLRLAIIYNYTILDGIDNQQKSQKAADYFRRDMLNYFPVELVETIAAVIAKNKDDTAAINAKSSLYLEVLNFADKIEFTNPVNIDDMLTSNNLYLTLTTEQKILFKQNLEAAVSGAKDLATVFGGLPSGQQEETPYATKYKLSINNERQQKALEYTQTPLTHINTALDNNVRRKIAMLAGIETCTDAEHKTCNPDTANGVMYGIHSSRNDLQQIDIPSNMTTLEKVQFEHDPTLLNANTLEAINIEVNRLKIEGIKMNLGTLSQYALMSDDVQKILRKRNIEVITEHRLRGYDDMGNPRYEEVLAPVSKSKKSKKFK
jgi:hypothetical protein